MATTATPGTALGSADAEPAGSLAEASGLDVAAHGGVTFVTGEATLLRVGNSSESLGAGTAVGSGDVLKTGTGTVVGMNFAGHTGLAVGENSILVVEGPAGGTPNSDVANRFSLPEGKAVFAGGANHADAVLIETPGGSLGVGQAGGSVKTLPDGWVELVLFPSSEENPGELVVTNAAGRFVIGTPYVVFTFDYVTPPAANALVPLDQVLSEFSAPLAALAAVVNQPLDQIIGNLVLEDRNGLADDSGLQLAGSDADMIEPGRTLAVTSFRAPVQEYFQEYPTPAFQLSRLPELNRDSGFDSARVFSGDEALNRGSVFAFDRASSGGVEGISPPRAANGPSAPAFSPDAFGGSSPGVTNGSFGGAPAGITNSSFDDAIPGIISSSSSETAPGVINSSPGDSGPSPDAGPDPGPDPDPTDGASGENGNLPDEPVDEGVTEGRVVTGTPFDDIFPTADHDNFQAIQSIDGREGLDTILGTDRNDVLDFRAPDAAVLISIERIDGGRGNDTIFGPEGNDVIQGGKGDDVLSGGTGNDELNGNDGKDFLDGGEGDDILEGHDGNDTLNGGGGNDILTGDDGDDMLDGGPGDDIFIVRGRTDGTDNFDGGSGNDTISGTDNDDVFHVLDGLANINFIETIDGRGGFDTLLGTGGNDVLDFGASNAPVLISIERIGGGGGSDTIIGTQGNDFIYGGDGNDVLRGGPGNDVLAGEAGSDIFVFRPGDGNNIITDFKNKDIVRLEGFAPAEVADTVWDIFNNTILAGSGSDQVSITLQGYSVADSGLPAVTAFDSSQMAT